MAGIASAEPSAPSSLTPAHGCGRRRQTASPSSLRASWALCGIWTSASTPIPPPPITIAAYAPVGSGLPGAKLDEVVGVVKAYLLLRGGRPLHLRVVRARGRGTAGGRRRVRCQDRPSPPGRPYRFWWPPATASGCSGATNIALNQAGCLKLHGAHPRLRCLRGGRPDHPRVSPSRFCWIRPSP